MKITDRIIQLLDLKGVTKYKFCKDLGVSSGFLDKPREISTDKYAKTLVYFKDVDPTWLLTGKGEMLKGASKLSETDREYWEERVGARDREIELLKENNALLKKNNAYLEEKLEQLAGCDVLKNKEAV